MAGPPARDQVLALLATVKNSGDLAVKLSSLKQAKDALLSLEPDQAAEFFPFLVDLQFSPDALVRKYLIEIIDELGAKTRESLSILLPLLITFLKDNNPTIAKQAIISGSNFFSLVLLDLAIQYQQHGIVERWLEELSTWMIKFKNAVLDIIFEAGPVGPKLVAVKFLETYVLHFTPVSNDFTTHKQDAMRQRGVFNISWVIDGHPILNQPSLLSDANRYLGFLLDMLSSSTDYPGSFIIAIVNSLASIARQRPAYYNSILSVLLNLRPNVERKGAYHTISIHYSIRTAFLGFLKCMHPVVVESRDRLLKELRAMNAGDAADHVIRQVEKRMKNNGRGLRDPQMNKEDPYSSQMHLSGDGSKKRKLLLDNESQSITFESTSKRPRNGSQELPNTTVDHEQDYFNGISPEQPLLDGDMSPVQQMIAMIGALIAEGERGVESLEILISNIHPDLLADIVITNMSHLPKNAPGVVKYINSSLSHSSDPSYQGQFVGSNGSASLPQILEPSSQVRLSSTSSTSFPSPEVPMPNVSTDLKRDPRRDPRRHDPRRMATTLDDASLPSSVDSSANFEVHYPAAKSDFDTLSVASLPISLPSPSSEHVVTTLHTDSSASELSAALEEQSNDEMQDLEAIDFTKKTSASLNLSSSIIGKYEGATKLESVDVSMLGETYSPSSQDLDEPLQHTSDIEKSEVTSAEIPSHPSYTRLSGSDNIRASQLALERLIQSYLNTRRADHKQTQIALVARLFALTDVDDMVGMILRCITSDYEQRKVNELVVHILYYLHSLMTSDSASTTAAVAYERFLLEVAKLLLDVLPATDKSFSRLLGEVPTIPDSVMTLLEDVCTKTLPRTDGHDGDRVTQGLGAVWSLILGRPFNRQACLDIALKCTVHPRDEVRTKAIRLVSNKLYSISYLTQKIEQHATELFLSTVKLGTPQAQNAASEQRIDGQVESMDTSASDSQISGNPNDFDGDMVDLSSKTHLLMSLFFALSAKKPVLLQQVFDNYGNAPESFKQAVQRHLSVLVRSLGQKCTELLNVISNPPQGSEDLVIQVLHVLSENTVPTPDLVATIKQLYETRLKDATVLIPILSEFSRDEVFPIFPHLIQLPLSKFQTALAHILQGSAHRGPALTPVEVLVAIHDISPEKDGIPLKKITDACSACFEQRTVFTQQVLTKALNQMVEQTPLPLLFMRTVIQAIDAFPTMVTFIMEILAKLVNRQIWRMPKLWIGFLKLLSQTQPHSFRVLVQLPSPQLESALNKYPNLRAPLAAHVNQSSSKADVHRSTLVLLGLASPS